MSVIIRLQNLPLEARSIDIRRFFDGLIIPDGGVHIIGGERGDAFIAFQSDEDARQAMLRDNNELCNARIRLFLSSKTEMQNKIAEARNAPTINANSSSTNFLSGLAQKTQPSSASSSDLLASLTKLISGSNSNTNNSSSSALSSLLPSATRNEPVIQSQPQQPAPAAKPSIDINQILGLLTQIKPDTLTTAINNTNTAANTNPNNGRNNLNNQEEDSNDGFNNRNRNFNNSSRPMSKPYLGNNLNNKRKYDDNNDNSNHNDQSDRKVPRQAFNAPSQTQSVPTRQNQLDPIILVKNFQNNCSYKDIRTFLQGIQIEHDGIRLLTDSNGNRNGTAFVKLVTITDLKKALCRNGQFYMDNQIDVSQSNEKDFNDPNFVVITRPPVSKFSQSRVNSSSSSLSLNSKDASQYNNQQPIDTSQGFFLKIMGLPADFDENELKSMFNNVKFVRIVTSVPTPIATKIVNPDTGVIDEITVMKAKKLCQVETQLDVERALTRQNERVGKGKIQVHQVSKGDFDREMAYIGHNMPELLASLKPQQENGDSPDNKEVEDINHSPSNNNLIENQNYFDEKNDDLYVHMTGVPFSARDFDVRAFFQNIHVKGVVLYLDPESFKPTGDCFCQFGSRQDRDRALEKDSSLFRNRVVKIKQIDYEEYQKHYESFNETKLKLLSNKRNDETTNTINDDSIINNNNNNNNTNSNFSNGKFSNNNRFNPNLNKFSSNNNINNNNSNNNNGNNKFSSFNNNNNNNNSNSNSNSNFINKRSNFNSNNNNGYQNNNNNNNYNNNNNGNMKRFKRNFNSNIEDDELSPVTLVDLPPLPPELQKYRNSLVLLSHVPAKASREDILDLFGSFSPLEHTLKIRQDDEGNPTGDAIVACRSQEDATRACRSLNNCDFMGKTIKAALVTP